MNSDDQKLRDLLSEILVKQMAHATFDDAVRNFPMDYINKTPNNSPHSFWELLTHIEYAFRDLIDYIEDPHYKLPNFPNDYWPKKTIDEINGERWNATINRIKELYDRTQVILDDSNYSLYDELTLRSGSNHSILREILITIDHNAFHIGQFVLMRKLLEIWP